MRTRTLPHVTLLVLLLAGAAQAQTIWRCGADGRGFSDRPSADGRQPAARVGGVNVGRRCHEATVSSRGDDGQGGWARMTAAPVRRRDVGWVRKGREPA